MALVAGSKPASWKGSFARPTQDFSFLRGGGVSGGGASKEFNESRPLGRRGKTEDEYLAEQRKKVEEGKNLSEMSLTEVLNSDLEIGVGTWTAPVLDSGAILPELIEADRLTVNSIKAEYINAKTLSAISADLGTITAGTITGATIQTDAAANTGVKIDSNGITGYDSTNTETFSIDATTGDITITQVIGGGSVSITGDVAIVDQALAGENITAGNAVIVGTGDTDSATQNSSTNRGSATNMISSNSWRGNTFTANTNVETIELVSIAPYLSIVGTPTSITVEVYALTGDYQTDPTGSALGSVTIPRASITSGARNTFTFSSPITLTAGNAYGFICRCTGVDVSNYFVILGDNSSSTLANAEELNSTDGGSSWFHNSVIDRDFLLSFNVTYTASGKLYKADANGSPSEFYDNFVGFALNTATAGNTVQFQADGVYETTGLTPGDIYYLSDTAGAISTAPGSNSVTVGKAISTTKLKVSII